MKLRIFILQRGWVCVGHSQDPETCGLWIPVHNARTVRRWGTSKGLEQLANDGPQRETVLEHIVKLRKIPIGAIIQIIDCDETNWSKQ